MKPDDANVGGWRTRHLARHIPAMSRFAVWGVACILVGSGFLANALWIWLRRRKFLAGSQPAVGTVVSVRVDGMGRNAISLPMLEFQTAAGALQRAESQMGSGFQSFQVGQTLAVRYDPRDPGRVEVASFAVLWGLALLRAGFGALFVMMGAVGLVIGAGARATD